MLPRARPMAFGAAALAAMIAGAAAPSCLVDVPPAAKEGAGSAATGSTSGQGATTAQSSSGSGQGGTGQGGMGQGGAGAQGGAGGQADAGQGDAAVQDAFTKCEDLDYDGACLGDLSMWVHTDGVCNIRDCPTEGAVCGDLGGTEGLGCLTGSGSTRRSCVNGVIGPLGECVANTHVWLQNGLCRGMHCPSTGRTCVFDAVNGARCQ